MNDELNNLGKLDDMPVSKAVFSNAIPAMIAMVMVLIYNMADLFFIGQTGEDLQVAAVSLATPLFLMFMSLGNVFGIGGASLLSREMGKGEHKTVRNISSFCFWSCLVLGVILSLGVFIGVTPIVKSLGASGEIASMVEDYLKLLALSGVFILFSSCYSALVRAEGNPKQAMVGMMLGNLTNIVLDPIFILIFNLGVQGAGIATAIGNTVGGLYYIFYLVKQDTLLSIKIKDFSMSNGILKNILMIGIPASLSTILMGASQMFINGQMASYGDLAVAGIGVAMKCTMITTMVCIGIGMGIQPILGYAIGSKNEKRYKEIFKFSMIFAFCVSAVLTAICYLFLNQIVSAFVSDIESFDYAYKFSQILISTSVIVSMLFVLSNALQAAGAAKPALIINVSRQGFLYIPLLFIMGDLMGINGLVFAQPVADVITLIGSGLIYSKVSKNFFSDDVDEYVHQDINILEQDTVETTNPTADELNENTPTISVSANEE